MPLLDKDNGNRLPAEFALIKIDDNRRAHHTFPNLVTQGGRLIHHKINTYMRNVLVEIFVKVCPDIVDTVDMSEYKDKNSEFHIRDALNNIVERFPFAVATLKAIEKHCFKGASLTNSMIRDTIMNYNIPKLATMTAIDVHIKWLEDFKDM